MAPCGIKHEYVCIDKYDMESLYLYTCICMYTVRHIIYMRLSTYKIMAYNSTAVFVFS